MRRHIGAIVLPASLAGCGGGGSSGEVYGDEWSEFPSGLRASVDAYAADRDCAGLQATFDTVDASDGSYPDILAYIDGKMSGAGCYG